jgi:hypothetical protein
VTLSKCNDGVIVELLTLKQQELPQQQWLDVSRLAPAFAGVLQARVMLLLASFQRYVNVFIMNIIS